MNVVYNNDNNKNKINKMKKTNLLKRVIQFFVEEQKLATIEVEGMGTLTADAFELDNIVYVDVEGAMQPLVSSSFTYDGFIYVTDETGMIVSKEVETPMEEEVAVEVETPETEIELEVMEEETEEEMVEDMVEEVEPELTEEDKVKMLEDKISELEMQIEILTKEKETINSLNSDLTMQLSKIPNSTKLKATIATEPKMETSMDVLRKVIEAGKQK
jgi:hypothetical protein